MDVSVIVGSISASSCARSRQISFIFGEKIVKTQVKFFFCNSIGAHYLSSAYNTDAVV